jgi:hypothetical protein
LKNRQWHGFSRGIFSIIHFENTSNNKKILSEIVNLCKIYNKIIGILGYTPERRGFNWEGSGRRPERRFF